AHWSGYLLTQMPEGTLVGDSTRIAITIGECVEGRGHNAASLAIAIRARPRLRGQPHRPELLVDSVTALAVVLVYRHKLPTPTPSMIRPMIPRVRRRAGSGETPRSGLRGPAYGGRSDRDAPPALI